MQFLSTVSQSIILTDALDALIEECSTDAWCVTVFQELAVAIKQELARQLAEEMTQKDL